MGQDSNPETRSKSETEALINANGQQVPQIYRVSHEEISKRYEIILHVKLDYKVPIFLSLIFNRILLRLFQTLPILFHQMSVCLKIFSL